MAKTSFLLRCFVAFLSFFTIFESVSAQTPVATPSPVQSGQVANCVGWRYVQSTDTCANIVSRFAGPPVSLTLANLLLWNPALKSDCSGLTLKYFVCVQVGAATTTRTTTATSTTTSWSNGQATPSPIQAGMVGNCKGWRYTQGSDTCDNIVARFQTSQGLTMANFLAWNPALGGTNCPGFVVGVFVCVAIDPNLATGPPTPSSTTTSRTTTTSSRITTTSTTTTTSSRITTTSSRTTTTSSRTTTTSSRTTTTASGGPTPVVGAGICANRLKIENMQATQPDAFNLLILALQRMQALSSTNDLSYYQLAGIHGAPFIPWQQPANGNYDRSVGYCTHHSVIFGTWHRPYLVLLEQTIVSNGLAIAQSFTGTARTTYLNAAAQLRLPYWDWADPNTQSRLPAVCMAPTIQVRVPNSAGNPVLTTIDNPLYAYNLNSADRSTFAGNFRNWPKTTRQPTTSGASRDSVADSTMQSGFSTRQRSTFNSFGRTSFNAFSNAIENVHDDVHSRVGGGGHMSYVPYSSFDPIFWLHHANIDRLFAMYQAANPGRLLASGPGVSTFGRPGAATDDINTPLIPFTRAGGSWWTSQHVSYANSTWLSGYGYPEVPCSYQGQTQAALDTFTTSRINALYSGTGSSSRQARRADGETRTEWEARIIVDQSELPGTFSIYIYLGTPESDYTLWPSSGKEVGSLSSLGFPDRKKKSMIRSAAVPISPALEEQGVDPNDMTATSAYLEEKLTWVVLNNGLPVDVQTLRSLKIAITATEVTISDNISKKAKWGRPKFHLKISARKKGGAKNTSDVESPTLLDGEKAVPPTGLDPLKS